MNPIRRRPCRTGPRLSRPRASAVRSAFVLFLRRLLLEN